jgi:phosphoribosylformylglycinamidine cyclo-ligase
MVVSFSSASCITGKPGDRTVFRGAVNDAWSMNAGDVAASGFVYELILNDVININKDKAPKDIIMAEVSTRFAELKQFYSDQGITVKFLGGETADLPDQVKTAAFDMAVFSRMPESQLIAGNVEPGDVIYGFASNGQAKWEDEENSGIMSNGLTMGRLKLMSKAYNEKYPELVREDEGKAFSGRFLVSNSEGRAVSAALMSPTRQWAVVIKKIISELEARDRLYLLHGIVMNTGGGATKIKNIGQHICYTKKMPHPPFIFRLIQEESGEIWKNMYASFNCGVGIDIVGSPQGGVLHYVLNLVAEWSGVHLFGLGKCSVSEPEENEVQLVTPYGFFHY